MRGGVGGEENKIRMSKLAHEEKRKASKGDHGPSHQSGWRAVGRPTTCVRQGLEEP